MSLRGRLLAITSLLACVITIASAVGGSSAFAAQSSCVGGGAGCFATIQPAIDAAHDGDTIVIGRGTYAGGIRIGVSVTLIGAGPRATIVKGGEHVFTIGEFGSASEPTVSISGMTITGAAATSSPESMPFFGAENIAALGGGIEVPPAAGFTTGAAVTISRSVISANRVAPTATTTFGDSCPNGPCPFALAAGAGIDNWGTMTLTDTTVSDNHAGSGTALGNVASDVEAGGIWNGATGVLRVLNSQISGNQSTASAPNGRFAENAGIWSLGALTIDDSVVSGNRSDLAAGYPNSVPTVAGTGGVHAEAGSATIRDSLVTGNTVSATNSIGDAVAIGGGVVSNSGSLVLRDSIVSNNRVSASVPTGSNAGAIADTGALGIGDASRTSVADTRFTGNTVSAFAPAGVASATAGVVGTGTTQLTTIADSVVSGNSVTAATVSGSVVVQGAGIWNIGLLALRDTTVSGNTGTGRGPTGVVQGGGIWNSAVPDGPQQEHRLVLTDSAVTGNTLTASTGITVHGGGVFTEFPVTLQDTVVTRNAPDQCFGC